MSVSGLPCQDFAMLVTLTPGVDRDRVLELLRSASTVISNNHGEQDGYVRWAQTFGWDIADAGDGGYRSWIDGGPQPWAGVVTTAPGRGQWLPSVVVDDLEKATEQAVSLGATVVRDASGGPAGTSATIADPGGAQLALFKPLPASTSH
jgi:uncharacterized protein